MSDTLFIADWNEAVKQVQIACGTTYTKVDLEGATRAMFSAVSEDVICLLGPSGDDTTLGIPFGQGSFSHTGAHSFNSPGSIGLKFSGDNPSVWVVSDDVAGVVNVTLFFDKAPGANFLEGGQQTQEPAKQDEEKEIARNLLSGGLSGLF